MVTLLRKYLWIIGLSIVVLAAVIIYYLIASQSPIVSNTDRGYPLHQSVQQAFTRSDKYYSLISQIDKAILEKDVSKKYQMLTSLFKKMNEAYKETGDARILAILYQIKNYASSIKGYQEEDFVIKVSK